MTHRSTIDSSEGSVLSIVSRVADEAGVEPTDLPPLYDAIDPEALSRLAESASGPLTVRFEFAGYEIRIDEAGDVELSPATERVPQR
ncbi:HalOD1 output domain-containing protein [Halovivax limisalsi]|uniref:HalOD1 output domain-containing protein n=1 Tax=Halovivax limisalsi TaxID=1453760 RepID=UPI001FFC5FF5|nr:HalOD1 output domain-containing protein [Halovivax limisalsi]